MQEFDKKHCPVCSYVKNVYVEYKASNETYYIECPRCGIYRITSDLVGFVDQIEKLRKLSPRISGYIRNMTEVGFRDTLLMTSNIDEISNSANIPNAKDIKRKTDLLLQLLKEKSPYLGATVELNILLDYPLVYAQSHEEIKMLLELLEKQGKIEIQKNQLTHDGSFPIVMTAIGLQEELSIQPVSMILPSVGFMQRQMSTLIKFFENHDKVLHDHLKKIEKLLSITEFGDLNTSVLLEIRNIIVLLYNRHKNDPIVTSSLKTSERRSGEINVVYTYLLVNGMSESQLEVLAPLYHLASKGKLSENPIGDNDILTAISGMIALLGLLKNLIEKNGAPEYLCSDCGSILNADERPCTSCGSSRRTVKMNFTDTLKATSKI